MRRRGSAALLALLVAAATPLGAHGARAASTPAGAASVETHCAVVLEAARPGDSTSRVRSSTCLRGAKPQVAASSVPILTIYEHINYGGSSKTFYGGDGPCDAAGYLIRDVGGTFWVLNWWETRVSSFMWGNNCSYVNAYQGPSATGYCVHYHGNVGYVGATMNDRIVSFRVSSAFRLCAG